MTVAAEADSTRGDRTLSRGRGNPIWRLGGACAHLLATVEAGSHRYGTIDNQTAAWRTSRNLFLDR
jgi:hypothetical protein